MNGKDKTVDRIKAVIDKWDPVGLLALGCPEDEYTPEAAEIAKLTAPSPSTDELAEGIRRVFTEYFGEDVFRCSAEDCRRAAADILTEG